MVKVNKISINLWFDDQALEAAEFYTDIFPDSEILDVTYYVEDEHAPHQGREGTIMTVAFKLSGSQFVGLNGGPQFKFNEAISLVIECEGQDEIDYYWNALTQGGDPEAQVCGWLKDKYGVSWQIVPTVLYEMTGHPDKEAVARMFKTMYTMKKLEIDPLRKAFNG